MLEVYTVYKSFPESYCEVSSEEEAKELVAELRRDRNLDDAFYEEIE